MARRRLDQYFTPRKAVEVLKKHIGVPTYIFEPCVGEGIIIDVFDPAISETNDIDENIKADWHFDACNYDNFGSYSSYHDDDDYADTWCISNPPYGEMAAPIVRNALEYYDNVAMLLRLSFLEPCKDRFDICCPDLLISMNRISFTGDGNKDSVTTAWFIWSPNVKKGIIVESKYADK